MAVKVKATWDERAHNQPDRLGNTILQKMTFIIEATALQPNEYEELMRIVKSKEAWLSEAQPGA